MSNPRITLSLSSEATPQALQSIANRIHVIGPCSQGPLNTPTAKNKLADLAVNGYGPGVSLAAEVYAGAIENPSENGLPVIFTRSATSTPSTLGSITKTPASAGTPRSAYGQVKLAGADADGDIYLHSLVSGVRLTVQAGGAFANSISGNDITLTVTAATAANAVKAYWDGIPALVSRAEMIILGTGLSNAGTTLAQNTLNNGNLTFTALDEGYSVEVIISGTNTPLSHAFGGVGNKELTINVATNADDQPTSTAAQVITELGTDIVGKLTATAGGTGGGLAGPMALTALVFGSTAAAATSGTPTDRYLLQVRAARSGALGASTVQFAADEPNPEDRHVFGTGNASLWFLAKRAGLSVEITQQTGASKDLTFDLTNGKLTINLGTSGGSAPNTTAGDVYTYLQGFPQVTSAFRFNFEVGDGTGVMVESGEVTLTDPSLGWSSELLVPVSGIVPLTDGKLTTGVTLTFTGTLEADDLWHVESTLPASNTADMRTALAAVLADSVNLGGTVVFASSFDRAGALLLDTDIQAALQSRQMSAIFSVRGIGEGVADETHDDWQADVTLDWIGFVSSKGALSACAGEYLHADSYTGRLMRRYKLWGAASRKAGAPYHQDLGKRAPITASGQIQRCLGLYHDEEKTPGLNDQRFITFTSAVERPGSKFITRSPTMADPSDSGYVYLEFRSTILVGLRIAKFRAFDLLLDTYPSIKEVDANGAPIGALTQPAASDIEETLGQEVYGEWIRKKSDGKSSIGPLPDGVKVVQVLRTNNYASDKTILIKINCPVNAPAEVISIEGVIRL